jgi:hypothetical protein
MGVFFGFPRHRHAESYRSLAFPFWAAQTVRGTAVRSTFATHVSFLKHKSDRFLSSLRFPGRPAVLFVGLGRRFQCAEFGMRLAIFR